MIENGQIVGRKIRENTPNVLQFIGSFDENAKKKNFSLLYLNDLKGVMYLMPRVAETELVDMYYRHLEGKDFLSALKNFCNKHGFGGSECVWCVFAGELEEWEEGYFGERGVCYFFDYPAVAEDQTLVLDYATFYHYLEKASMDYLNRHPNAENKVKAYLHEIKTKLDI